MKAIAIKAFVLCLNLILVGCLHPETNSDVLLRSTALISVDPEVHATHKLDWTAMSQYVAMKLPYEPIAAVKNELEKLEGVSLQSRGEAHLTVINPSEMSALRSRLSLEEINGAIAKMSLQSIPFQLRCLGRGQLKEGGRILSSYFIVVQAPGLLQVREKLRHRFVAAGGDRRTFVAENFQPHITVGFTDRDLHAEDGIIKDEKSCLYGLE